MLKLARLLKGDKAAVAITLVGTIAQAFHTRKIVLYSSTLGGWIQEIQADMLAVFFSFSLMIFTFRAGQDKYSISERMQYETYAKALFIFEWLVNWHYYIRRFIIEPYSEGRDIAIIDWYDLGISLVYGFFLPFMIKSYAGYIKIPSKEEEEAQTIKLFKLLKKGTPFEILRYKTKDRDGKSRITLKLKK